MITFPLLMVVMPPQCFGEGFYFKNRASQLFAEH